MSHNQPPPLYRDLRYSSLDSSKFPPSKHQRAWNFIRHSRDLRRAVPAALAASLWSTQMMYFFVWFVTRPSLPNGSWARVGPSYAAFPFISCIGAVRVWCFRSVSMTVASLLWTAFGIDYWIGRQSWVGRYWRLGKVILSSISSVFLVALAFESVNDHHKLHLIFTSIQIICMGAAKICDWNLNREMKNATPGNRYLRKSRAWKRVAAAIALPASIITIIGIYFCSAKFENGEVTFTPECWTLVSLAAVAEWTLSWCWMIFLGTLSYDAFHMDYTIRLLLSQSRVTSTAKRFDLKFWRTNEEERTDLQKQGDVEIAETLEQPAEERVALYPHTTVIGSESLEEQSPIRGNYEADEFEVGLMAPTRPRSMVGSGRDHW